MTSRFHQWNRHLRMTVRGRNHTNHITGFSQCLKIGKLPASLGFTYRSAGFRVWIKYPNQFAGTEIVVNPGVMLSQITDPSHSASRFVILAIVHIHLITRF
jgi:hypothetical protein